MELNTHRKHPDAYRVEIEVLASEEAEAVNASSLDTLAPHSEEIKARDDVADGSCVVCFEWPAQVPEGMTRADYESMQVREAALLVTEAAKSEGAGTKLAAEGKTL